MVSVTRFTPFDNSVDELLRGFFVRPMALEGAPAAEQAGAQAAKPAALFLLLM